MGIRLQMMISQVVQTVVKYQEYYLYIPKVGIKVKPYQLWTPSHITTFRASNWLLVVGVVLMLVVHLEEILVSLSFFFMSGLDAQVHARASSGGI